MWTRRNWLMLAAVGGFLGVAGGAFGAHGAADERAASWLQTGGHYALIHAVAIFACAAAMEMGAARARFVPPLFLGGMLLFTGSLFAMALGAPRWLGAVTPVGGSLFLLGWLVLAWAVRGVRPG